MSNAYRNPTLKITQNYTAVLEGKCIYKTESTVKCTEDADAK